MLKSKYRLIISLFIININKNSISITIKYKVISKKKTNVTSIKNKFVFNQILKKYLFITKKNMILNIIVKKTINNKLFFDIERDFIFFINKVLLL